MLNIKQIKNYSNLISGMTPTTLAYVILILLLGIQQQNIYLLASAFGYFLIMILLEPYVQLHYIELVGIVSIILIWMVLIKLKERKEYFNVPNRACTLYFTNYKAECDNGIYLLSDIEFNNLLKTYRDRYNLEYSRNRNSPSTVTALANYNKYLAIGRERSNLNGICRQDFPGWSELSTHPFKLPSEIQSRGNLRDWAYCYKPLFDTGSAEVYNACNVEAAFYNYRDQFNDYNLVSVDQVYAPVPTNSNLRYNRATPEYIRMYFKSPTTGDNVASKDPPATCDNNTVTYRPNYPVITPPQYGFELGITQTGSSYTLSSLSLIRTASIDNSYQFMYENTYNDPNYNILTYLLFDYVRSGTNILLQPKPYNDANTLFRAYKFYNDICNRLSYVNSLNTTVPQTRDMRFDIRNKFNVYPTVNKTVSSIYYPFGIRDELTNITINNYDKNALIDLNNRLDTFKLSYNSLIDSETAKHAALVEPPKEQRVGYIRNVYTLSNIYNNITVNNKNDMDIIENIITSSRMSRIDYSTYSDYAIYVRPSLPTYNINTPELLTNANTRSIFHTYEGYINLIPGNYDFKLVIHQDVTANTLPNRFYTDMYITDITSNLPITNIEYYKNDCVERCFSMGCNSIQCANINERKRLCKFPDWNDVVQNRDQSHHIVSSNISLFNNVTSIYKIKFRVFSQPNLPQNPRIFLLYKKTSDPKYKIFGYTSGVWGRYSASDYIYYDHNDYSISLKNIYYYQNRIDKANTRITYNQSLIDTVTANEQTIARNFINSLIGKDASWIGALNIQQNLSQNNRMYLFYKTPRYVTTPLSVEQEKEKIRVFNEDVIN